MVVTNASIILSASNFILDGMIRDSASQMLNSVCSAFKTPIATTLITTAVPYLVVQPVCPMIIVPMGFIVPKTNASSASPMSTVIHFLHPDVLFIIFNILGSNYKCTSCQLDADCSRFSD
jgi:hypothetical protein